MIVWGRRGDDLGQDERREGEGFEVWREQQGLLKVAGLQK